jgi:hypothetical protein
MAEDPELPMALSRDVAVARVPGVRFIDAADLVHSPPVSVRRHSARGLVGKPRRRSAFHPFAAVQGNMAPRSSTHRIGSIRNNLISTKLGKIVSRRHWRKIALATLDALQLDGNDLQGWGISGTPFYSNERELSLASKSQWGDAIEYHRSHAGLIGRQFT